MNIYITLLLIVMNVVVIGCQEKKQTNIYTNKVTKIIYMSRNLSGHGDVYAITNDEMILQIQKAISEDCKNIDITKGNVSMSVDWICYMLNDEGKIVSTIMILGDRYILLDERRYYVKHTIGVLKAYQAKGKITKMERKDAIEVVPEISGFLD